MNDNWQTRLIENEQCYFLALEKDQDFKLMYIENFLHIRLSTCQVIFF